MKKGDFSNKTPGKLIRSPKGFNYFVPNPLPPKEEWSSKLMAKLSSADRAITKLSGIGSSHPMPFLALGAFVRKEAVYSSQIEGTQTSFAALLAFEARTDKYKNINEDAQEVQNYQKALDYGLSRLDTLPLSARLIREIHKILMAGVRGEHMTPGEFRTSPNWVGRAGATLKTAAFVPPIVDEMNVALSDLQDYIHDDTDLPPLIRIGLIHYQFETIHPFLDGNGRVGRLLISLLTVAWGLLPYPLLYLSNFIEANRAEYYLRLQETRTKGKWEEWLAFFLDGVKSQADDARKRIDQLDALRKKYSKLFARARNRTTLESAVDFLIGTPITSVSQLQKALGYSKRYSAQRQVDRLVELGILQEATGFGRNRIFRAEEILEILEARV